MDKTIDLDIGVGPTLRFALLMTHYRSPCEIGPAKRKEAAKALRRLAMACEPNLDGPPVEFIEILCNDINTPGAIALLHQYRGAQQGKKLFAAMRFLGFFNGTALPDEIKTLPADHVWQREYIGPATLGEA